MAKIVSCWTTPTFLCSARGRRTVHTRYPLRTTPCNLCGSHSSRLSPAYTGAGVCTSTAFYIHAVHVFYYLPFDSPFNHSPRPSLSVRLVNAGLCSKTTTTRSLSLIASRYYTAAMYCGCVRFYLPRSIIISKLSLIAVANESRARSCLWAVAPRSFTQLHRNINAPSTIIRNTHIHILTHPHIHLYTCTRHTYLIGCVVPAL
jgi:hypothetical protein